MMRLHADDPLITARRDDRVEKIDGGLDCERAKAEGS